MCWSRRRRSGGRPGVGGRGMRERRSGGARKKVCFELFEGLENAHTLSQRMDAHFL
jgi:hypothetical protein